MPHPRPLPDELGEYFSVRDALEVGASSKRLRARDLDATFHGARRVHRATDDAGIPDNSPLALDRQRRATVLRDARTYAEIMRPGAFFSGRTAACLYGAPLSPDTNLDVAVFAPQRAPRARGIRGRKVAAHLATVQDFEGLPMSSPATTWTMLGRDLSERELISVGDALVRVPRDSAGRQLPELALTTLEELKAATDAGSRPATRALRAALDRVRVGSSSPLETEFRLDADAFGLPVPALDREIRDQSGRLLGISEFVYPEFRTVIEIEGDHHRTSRAQWHRDIEKYQAYQDAGWHVVRLTSKHVRASRQGVSIVAAALRLRGWSGLAPQPPRCHNTPQPHPRSGSS